MGGGDITVQTVLYPNAYFCAGQFKSLICKNFANPQNARKIILFLQFFGKYQFFR